MPTWKQQRFTAPGTWTWPGVANVEVIVVGGGGGGYSTPTPRTAAGGGGGYRREWWPVSGPVPITVGAAGTTSFNTSVPGGTGGTTYFGPAGPGPIPLIPASTVAVGGGGGGGCETPSGLGGIPAPPIGGGGGTSANILTAGYGGRYGQRGFSRFGGGASTSGWYLNNAQQAGAGVLNMGGGGTVESQTSAVDGGARTDPANPGESYPATNFGGGGAAGASASAGVVIVRWFE
jgi:hypothetical protein